MQVVKKHLTSLHTTFHTLTLSPSDRQYLATYNLTVLSTDAGNTQLSTGNVARQLGLGVSASAGQPTVIIAIACMSPSFHTFTQCTKTTSQPLTKEQKTASQTELFLVS